MTALAVAMASPVVVASLNDLKIQLCSVTGLDKLPLDVVGIRLVVLLINLIHIVQQTSKNIH